MTVTAPKGFQRPLVVLIIVTLAALNRGKHTDQNFADRITLVIDVCTFRLTLLSPAVTNLAWNGLVKAFVKRVITRSFTPASAAASHQNSEA